MDISAEVLEFPVIIMDDEKKPKEKKPKVKKEDTENTSEPKEEENKEPEQPKEKMLKLSIMGPIRRGIFTEYLERLGPTVEDKDRDRVLIYISSPGGDVDASLAAISVLDVWPQPHVIIAGGVCASAATLFIAHGNLRLAFPTARFMMHDTFSFNDGSVSEQENYLNVLKENRQNYTQLYQDHIGLTKKELEKILRKDTYFNAVEALELGTKGLIDGIIVKLLDGFKYEILMRNGVRKVVDLHNDDFNEIRNLTLEAVKDPAIVEVN